jgi:MFS family permease/osmotically-inducible protein OsmY
MTTVAQRQDQPIRSTIPARLDRLRWSPFHTRLVLGLGTAWILDGLSVTIASSVTSKLTQPGTLHLTTTQAASIGTVYLVGEVIGALVFGRLSDQLGRRNLFMWTLANYLVGTALTALTPRGAGWIVYLYATRVIAGMGIGGEYSAINSAIDEMMPARYRGRTDVWINGTYWLGAAIGTLATFLILSTFRTSEGWRIAFLVGPALAIVILVVRRNLPESPRWLITHGRQDEAEAAIRRIEQAALRDGQRLDPVPDSAAIVIVPEKRYGYLTLLGVAFRRYPKRAVLGATLMITQSFLYNAIFFTYALVLTKFYHVSNNSVPLYGLAFAVGNLAGPLLLGQLFDSVGRKKMISGTYLLSGALLAFSAWLFAAGVLSAAGQTFIWIVIFFFASAGASAGYLTVSEIFPIEIRAEALAVFFALAQIFGAVGPAFYGFLIGAGTNRANLAIGYLVGGAIMIIGGLVELAFGVNAEGKSLEAVAEPLTKVNLKVWAKGYSAWTVAQPRAPLACPGGSAPGDLFIIGIVGPGGGRPTYPANPSRWVMRPDRGPRHRGDGAGTHRRRQPMKTDSEIRDDVIRELQWDYQVSEPDAIGVAVKDGGVTLTGHTPSYAEKLAAERAAERVYGVKVVANDLKVQLPGTPRDDGEIATAIAHVLDNNVQIPQGQVRAKVESGWVTLEGTVTYAFQRREVERMVRQVRGVVGVTDLINISPPVLPGRVAEAIEDAFKREAEVDARHVRVEVSDHTAKLYGHVHSLKEASAARAAAASAPGVATVESHLLISP